MPPHARTAGDAADAAADEHAAAGEDAVPAAGTADDPAGEDGARAARSGGDASPEGELARALDAAVAAVAGTRREGQVLMAEAVAHGAGRRRPPAGAGGHGHRQVAGVPRAGDAARHERRPAGRGGDGDARAAAPARRARPAARRRRARAGARAPADVRGAQGPRTTTSAWTACTAAPPTRPTTRPRCSPRPPTALGRQAKKLREWADEHRDRRPRRRARSPSTAGCGGALSVSGRECVGAAKCPYGEECFAELAREQARKESQVVVTNHAMLAIHTLEDVPVLPEHDAVVVDEGHELVDRATQAVDRRAAGRDGRAGGAARPQAARRRRARPARVRCRGPRYGAGRARRAAGAGASSGSRAGSRSRWRRSATPATPRSRRCPAARTGIGPRPTPRRALRCSARAACSARCTTSPARCVALDEHDVAWLDAGDRRRAGAAGRPAVSVGGTCCGPSCSTRPGSS